MFEQHKSFHKLHSHFFSLFAFILVAGIAFGLFGTAPASAAIHKAMRQANTTYPYKLVVYIQDGEVALQTNGSGIVTLVWSDNMEVLQIITGEGSITIGNITPNKKLISENIGKLKGKHYFQLLDEQGNAISNQVGVSAGSSGVSVFCGVEGHYGACPNDVPQASNFSNEDQNVALECIDSSDLNCEPNLTGEVV